MDSLAQVAIVLVAAVGFVALFRWLRLSSVLGFVAAGVAIGPYGFGWIRATEDLQHVSEFGVVLLMFVIGLELQPSRLWVLRKAVFGLGALQVGICAALLAAGAWMAGLRGPGAAIVAFGLAMSSTAMCLQVLAERQQLRTQHGRAAFGILLFQDLAVLPVLTLVPLLAAGADGAASPGLGLAKLAGAVAIILFAGRLLLRPALRAVAATKVTEVFTAAALLIVVATALLVDAVGLSMSLGAFLAGVLLADSEFRHELEADIEPFKGLLLGLFFVSVGLSTNLALLAEVPLEVAGITLGFMGLKALGLGVVARFDRMGAASGWRLALLLAGGGEFAYVLFALAGRAGLVDAAVTARLTLAATLSMALAPVLLTAYDALARRRAPGPAREPDAIEAREGDVLIVGFGRFGQIVGRILRGRRIPFTALDASPSQIDFLRRFGNRVYYGDATRLDVLRAAGAAEARLLVLAIDDVEASLKAAAIVREQFPHLKVLARARSRQHAFQLMELGIEHVFRETLGTSLEVAERALEALGDTATRARATVRRFRDHDEATLIEQFGMRDDADRLIASAAASARQLEQLFEADRRAAEGPDSGSLSRDGER
ncbi:MAG: monovalent cation:proton antiporter-2 (CPA2) family protein [Steroidobacteraceae bacterium]